MKIIRLNGLLAECEAKGVRREVNLLMLQGEPLAVGEYVMVQRGYAHEKMTEEEAQAAWEVYDSVPDVLGTCDL
ncbi:putative Hydrogenase maturation protein HypC [Magnetofaba australis IT-1]|uniref:Putative Hydrogenase maturation protein HypC n=2 Tax=Magnetofaba TaxID=1472292 RepID=A0A1Y2K482_9PROT|nr:putative Hydrogenase maturation protein HypC [Magnetofaba australis IT-1]